MHVDDSLSHTAPEVKSHIGCVIHLVVGPDIRPHYNPCFEFSYNVLRLNYQQMKNLLIFDQRMQQYITCFRTIFSQISTNCSSG